MTTTATGAGRPRSVELTQRVLSVAEDLFGRKGFGAVTMAEVATTAGVGLDSIYRRWTSKQQLLMDVVVSAADSRIPIASLGSIEDDLTEAVRGIIRLGTSPAGRVLAAAIGEAAHDPELAARLAIAQAARRALSLPMVQRAVERGELPADVDADMLLDLLSGVVWQRAFISGHRFSKDEPRRIVRRVLAAFRS